MLEPRPIMVTKGDRKWSTNPLRTMESGVRYNIWIRKEVNEKFSSEALKSELINNLLLAHYKGSDVPKRNEIKNTVEGLAKAVGIEPPTVANCKHLNIDKRHRICNDCGEPL